MSLKSSIMTREAGDGTFVTTDLGVTEVWLLITFFRGGTIIA